MSVISMPWRILTMVLLALSCIGFGYVEGVSRESDRRDAQDLKTSRAVFAAHLIAQQKADKESTRREAIGKGREVSRENIRIVYRTIREKADGNVKKQPGINTCGLDADGLRLWNAANTGEISRATRLPSEFNHALSNTTQRQVRHVGRLIPQSHRGHGVGRAVSGSTEKINRMRSEIIYE